MASKQLGKLRQWAGEVISSRDKTIVTEEFHELEKDIELRREGIRRLELTSKSYHHTLCKKKECEALDEPGKLLPIDALGVVMILHGEEFGEDSAFGTSLIKLGRAHCKVATLQEAFALTFQDTFLASMEKSSNDFKDYDLQRKKLESKRLSYDAAITKADKAKKSKKEKDCKEAEEEMEQARQRYDETCEDVRARMYSIQDNEIKQLRELTAFLDLEMNFVQQYLGVLQDVKSEWCDEADLKRVDLPRERVSSHVFPRSTDDVIPNSQHSKRPVTPTRPDTSRDLSESEDAQTTQSRGFSLHRNKSDASTKTPSRPSSRASRKRSDSSATASGEKETAGTRLAGWASAVTGRGKKKEKFAALKDHDDDESSDDGGQLKRSSSLRSASPRKSSRKKSKESLVASPKLPVRILKPPSLQDRTIVRALDDFNGSVDELSFKAGDEIVVVNEVLDGWWMGELDGRTGLFPTSYTEIIAVLPSRLLHQQQDINETSGSSTLAESDGYGASDLEEDHLIPVKHAPTDANIFYGQSDDASITGSIRSAGEEDFSRITLNSLPVDPHPPPIPRRLTTDAEPSSSTPGKRAPPPPPPRRSTNSYLTAVPPIPPRPRSSSSLSTPTLSASISGDTSPFESTTDLETASSAPSDAKSLGSLSIPSRTMSGGGGTSPFESTVDFRETGCGHFKQNPFKPLGMCNNCFKMHM